MPMRQCGDQSSADLVVRSTLPAAPLAPAVRAALKPLAPNLAGNDFRTLQQLVDKSVSPRRFVVLLLGGFAVFALILASLGIYALDLVLGESAHAGDRHPDGARRLRARRAGPHRRPDAAAGGDRHRRSASAASWALARSLSGLLFGVTATDPVTFLGMLLVLAIVADAGRLPAGAPRVADRSAGGAPRRVGRRSSHRRFAGAAPTASFRTGNAVLLFRVSSNNRLRCRTPMSRSRSHRHTAHTTREGG